MVTRPRLKVLTLVAIAFVVIGLLITFQPESPLDRAYRICQDCGLYEPEIVELIEQVRSSGLTPKEAIEVWKQTAEPGAVELCRDCAEAVVGVVE